MSATRTPTARTRRGRGLALLLLLALAMAWTAGAPARAGEPWEDEEAFAVLRREEQKVLRGLLDRALDKEYRRQAWYFADRLAQVDPTDERAIEVLDRWTGEELQQGQAPNAAFVKKRDRALEALGDAYFHFGETLDAAGMDPATYYPINVRAHAYGSRAVPLVTALAAAGYVWLGVYGAKPRVEVEALLEDPVERYRFPEEYEDDYLAARAVWPAARGAGFGVWRLLTDHGHEEALRLLGMLAAAEAWLVEHLGSHARKSDDQVVDIYVFSQWQDYDKVGVDLVNERWRTEFAGTSGWYDPWARRLLVTWRHRHNPWLGDDDLVLGHAATVMARRHLGAGAAGLVQGRGAWLLDGLRGAFEGFRLDEDGRGTIDPQACWRLVLAHELREQGALLPWPVFLEMDRAQARAQDRPTLTVRFGAATREAKEIDRVAAQATALVVGILKADGGKHADALGDLVGDLYKRDSLPDLDKALRVRKGTVIRWAETAMDAAKQP